MSILEWKLPTRPRPTPHVRWRSRRRRSNEKSAKQIRRETPPFWRLMSYCKRDSSGREWIMACAPRCRVIINGAAVDLPHEVSDADHVIIETSAPAGEILPVASPQLQSPPPWVVKGGILTYLGEDGAPALHGCRVLEAPFRIGRSGWLTLIDKHRGWVRCDHLVPA